MSLFRRLANFRFARGLGGAWRAAAAALLLAALVQPGAAPIMAAPFVAAPAAVAPIAPQTPPCTDVVNPFDSGSGSLRAAVACATSGQTVTLDSILVGTTLYVTSTEIAVTVPITIDGSLAPGAKVEAQSHNRVFNINTIGTVTLKALTLQHGKAASGNGGALLANNNVVLDQVQVFGSTAPSGMGGGLYANSTATLTGTQFISNTSFSDGGAAWVNFTTVVTNGRFERNMCTGPGVGSGCQGGGLNPGPLTLTGTQFISNTSAGQGGGLYAYGAASLTNGTLQGNQCVTSACNGGGLYGNSTLTLSSTDLISNTSAGDGGGAYGSNTTLLTAGRIERNLCTDEACRGGGVFASSSLTVTSTDFISNTSLSHGGGAYAAGAAWLTNGLFQGNHCIIQIIGCRGGGLHAATTLTLNGTQFITNTSTLDGGGAWAGAAALTNGRFENNRSYFGRGGGLYANDTLTLSGTQFISNTTYDQGGGARAGGTASLVNGSFQGNQCTYDPCDGGGLFSIGTLTLSGTDFINNIGTGDGGGVYAEVDALLTNGRFQGNQCAAAAGSCYGGGLHTNTNLTLTGTQFISNSATSDGGGAHVGDSAGVANGQFRGNKCTAAGCVGGGLYASTGLTATSTDFISNTSDGNGGGVITFGDAVVTAGRFERNMCTGSGCQGGGLFATFNDTAQVLSSSFSANQSAGSGGAIGITNTAQLTLANVTLSGNRAAVSGGGLNAGGASTAALYNVTVADNQALNGGGVFAQAGATVGISNTLFSNNSANNSASNCFGPIANGTHNLEWPAATCNAFGPTAGFTTADPLLGPLALNPPGTTLTRALQLGSAARDTGDAATCAAAPVNNRDQRGVARPIRGLPGPGAAICDIGAYEAAAMVPFLWLPLVRK